MKLFHGVQGFRKVDPDKWEFAHQGFLRGHRHLLKNIVRRKTSNGFGLDAEIDRLMCDKQVLAMEFVKHRQQQLATFSLLRTMEHRLQGAERKQKQALNLLAKAMHNPTSSQQKSELGYVATSNKRKRSLLDHVTKNEEGDNTYLSTNVFQEIGQGSKESAYEHDVGIEDGNLCVKLEPREYGEIPRFGDFEELAVSMKKSQLVLERKTMDEGDFEPIDEGFWERLINEGIEEIDVDECDGHDLAEQLRFLGSNPR